MPMDHATTSSTRHAADVQPGDDPTADERSPDDQAAAPKSRQRRKNTIDAESDSPANKRRCVSTACIACRRARLTGANDPIRKRKSKCDGNIPACAACSQVYGTECIYDPNSDHRRKGVYKSESGSQKTRTSTFQTLIRAIIDAPEAEVHDLVREIRTCESLDAVAERIKGGNVGPDLGGGENDISPAAKDGALQAPTLGTQLYTKMGDLRLDEGSVRYIGGTSNLIHFQQDDHTSDGDEYQQQEESITAWTEVTDDAELVLHLVTMYFTWHYTYFTTLSKTRFYHDFLLGPSKVRRKTQYCTPLLVNAILALACHFTSHIGARENPHDSATAGDHFFREAKRLIMENDEHEKPRLTTVQALALMSVREAGCGREAKGWVYSGMSFRMACDMGLNLDSGHLTSNKGINADEDEEDTRRVTFWGCFLFDKCWSNYLGRLPQLPRANVTVPKVEVFPDEDSAQWSPYSDSGFTLAHAQPARTRAVALQITKLCEISGDIMRGFYDPTDIEKPKGKAAELKKLSDIHTRLESWRRDLPKELEPKEGGLSSVLVMHMFFQLLFLHLFRPFLMYTLSTSPLPRTISPRKLCTQAAAMISKLMRLYKRSYGLRQICNIAVYIAHSACTIHLLNLPDKNARRDIIHGVKHLEEIAEGWLCARRTLAILSLLARKWNVDLPEEAAALLARTDAKFGSYASNVTSPKAQQTQPAEQKMNLSLSGLNQAWQAPAMVPVASGSYTSAPFANTGASDGAVAPVHANSGRHAPPTREIKDTYSQQIPPMVATPQTQLHRSRDSIGTSRSAASPSDMYGGLEQLVRDSQNWVYQDQAQFARGFENWDALDMDPLTWTANNGPGAAIGSGHPVGGLGPNPMAMPDGNTNAYTSNTGLPGAVGNGMMGWSNGGINPYINSMASYNEHEWYQ